MAQRRLIVRYGSWFNSDRRVTLGVLAVALTARLAFLAARGPNLTPDSNVYLLLAHNMVTYGVYSFDKAPPITPSVWFPPLYPMFLALGHWIGASVSTVAIVQAVIGAISAVLIFVLAKKAVSVNWAALIAFFYAVHPGAINSARSILTETLFTFLLLATVCVLVAALNRNRFLWTAVAGVLMALAILCRSVVELLPIAFAAVMLTVPKLVFRIRHVVVLIVCVLALIAPWSIRSSLVAGRLIPVQDSASFATLFYVATQLNWDQADEATLWPRQALEVDRLRAEALAQGETAARDMPSSHLLFRQGWRNVRQNPTGYLVSRLQAFPYFFLTSYDSFSGINTSLGTLVARRDFLRLALKLCFLFVFSLMPFVLALVGLLHSRKNLAASLSAIVWLYMLAIYFPVWVEPRYWLPAVPFLLVSSAVGGSFVVGLVRSKAGVFNVSNKKLWKQEPWNQYRSKSH